MIGSLLIANRGEIAVRIIRTCRRLGIRAVAVYSDADRDAPHVRLADEALRIGPPPARDSYLRADAIIEAARRAGAEAIHPGYGFLSEKPELPTLCAEAGLVFVGPSADRIAAMGQKIGAKRIAEQAGVPCAPGYGGGDQSDARLREEAERIGFPVMVKASAGGGGRGMRRVFSAAELPSALDLARREAEAAFGDPTLLIEKLVTRPRHLEVQVAGDKHGAVVHLFERDCSVQRNNQKLLEEAPAPNLPQAVRHKLLARGVALASAISYDNLGTVEFILEEGHDEPWFLEMNTRLQVEHPVTEAITGFDLVEWQIRIASGEPLPARQDEIQARGHAIEARITAERADLDFRPDTGRIVLYREPPSIRVDGGVAAGSEVTSFYDSLLCKAIAYGHDRAEALRRLAAGLKDFALLGPATTIPFLVDAIEHPLFAQGRATTRFIADAFPEGWTPRRPDVRLARAAAALWFAIAPRAAERAPPSAWTSLSGFRLLAPSGGAARTEFLVEDGGAAMPVSLTALPDGRFRVRDADGEWEIALRCDGAAVEIAAEGRALRADAARSGDRVRLVLRGSDYDFRIRPAIEAGAAAAGGAGSGIVHAPMPGVVAEIKVGVGERVAAGQAVAVLESMKLFIPLATEVAGTVAEIAAAPGETVGAGAQLLVVAPDA